LAGPHSNAGHPIPPAVAHGNAGFGRTCKGVEGFVAVDDGEVVDDGKRNANDGHHLHLVGLMKVSDEQTVVVDDRLGVYL